MKLLLTSNGLVGSLQNTFLGLLKKPVAENNVVFITTAAYGESSDTSWLNTYRESLQKLGITHIEDFDLQNKTQKEVEKVLENADVVFVNGGNTYFLLYWARKSGFDIAIKKFVLDGKLYVGVSAGTILCCPTIENALWEPEPDKNKVGIQDLTGLGFVSFLIAPHVSKANKHSVQESAGSAKYSVVGLYDDQAILVEDNFITRI